MTPIKRVSQQYTWRRHKKKDKAVSNCLINPDEIHDNPGSAYKLYGLLKIDKPNKCASTTNYCKGIQIRKGIGALRRKDILNSIPASAPNWTQAHYNRSEHSHR